MTTQTPVLDTRSDTAGVRLRFAGVLRSEVVKLTSLRSTRVAALGVVLLLAGGMVLRAFAYAQTAGSGPLGVSSSAGWSDVLDVGARGGELAAMVLGTLVVGADHTGRAALTTFVAVPRRRLVLAAKAVVVVVALALLGAVGLLLGAVLAAPFMTSAGLGGPTSGTVGDALPGLGLVLALGLLSVAVTTLVRSTAGGIAVMFVVLLVLPVGVSLLGRALGVDLSTLLLTYAAPMALALADPDGAGALTRDVVVTLAWLVVPGAAAAVALSRRDV